jgi:hypothetical protein
MENPVDIIRQRLGLSTDAEVAALAGVVFQTTSAWRTRGKVPLERCWKIADRSIAAGLMPAGARHEFVEDLWRASQPPGLANDEAA